MKKTNRLAGALTALFTMLAAPAADADNMVDPVALREDQMNMRYFLFETDFNLADLTVSVHRGSYDEVLGVQCEWRGTASIGLLGGYVRIKDVAVDRCEQKPLDPAWANSLPEESYDDFMGPGVLRVTFDPATNTVTEHFTSPRTEQGLAHFNQRVWDLKNGRVCLSAEERQQVTNWRGVEVDRYVRSGDKGCYDMPDNEYARDLIARHAR